MTRFGTFELFLASLRLFLVFTVSAFIVKILTVSFESPLARASLGGLLATHSLPLDSDQRRQRKLVKGPDWSVKTSQNDVIPW